MVWPPASPIIISFRCWIIKSEEDGEAEGGLALCVSHWAFYGMIFQVHHQLLVKQNLSMEEEEEADLGVFSIELWNVCFLVLEEPRELGTWWCSGLLWFWKLTFCSNVCFWLQVPPFINSSSLQIFLFMIQPQEHITNMSFVKTELEEHSIAAAVLLLLLLLLLLLPISQLHMKHHA